MFCLLEGLGTVFLACLVEALAAQWLGGLEALKLEGWREMREMRSMRCGCAHAWAHCRVRWCWWETGNRLRGVHAEFWIATGEGAGGDSDAGGVVGAAVGAVSVGAERVEGVDDAGGIDRVAVAVGGGVGMDVGDDGEE